MRWQAVVTIDLKPGTLDPQGEAIRAALERLGHTTAGDVRVGKRLRLAVEAPDRATAHTQVEAACKDLVNPVLEQYAFELAAEANS